MLKWKEKSFCIQNQYKVIAFEANFWICELVRDMRKDVPRLMENIQKSVKNTISNNHNLYYQNQDILSCTFSPILTSSIIVIRSQDHKLWTLGLGDGCWVKSWDKNCTRVEGNKTHIWLFWMNTSFQVLY